MTLRGKKILVTGGTGFIGGRLVEKLVLECDAQVRVLVRMFAHSTRIARFPLEMVKGDVTDSEAVRRAAEGCDVIFHCAYGSNGTPEQQRAATVNGTEAVAKAALATGVCRLVHASTMSVYGRTPDGNLDETAPRQRLGDTYGDSKLEAESLLFDYHKKHRLPVAIIQPAIVYGPFGGVWTIAPIDQIKKGRVVLVNGGDGLCNAVYVDDVVNAMILGATRNEAIGEAFLVSGEEPVTWREFYASYERMLCMNSIISMSVDEIRAYVKQQKKMNGNINRVLRLLREKPKARAYLMEIPALFAFYRILRSVFPESLWKDVRHRVLGNGGGNPSFNPSREKLIIIPDKTRIVHFSSKTHVCISKARQLLGFQPMFDFKRGMYFTELWARWANLLN